MKRSIGEISAVYIISDSLSQYHKESTTSDMAFKSFDSHENLILNNSKGGVGYFAEVHHAASFNVNQVNANLSERAIQLDSREFGSVDIQTNSGGAFNPKYYASAQQSYEAGAELVQTETGIIAKYAGQHIVVPSDQLEDVLQQHRNALAQAEQQGDGDYYNALSSIHFTDRVVSETGIASTPLTYQEAKQGVLDMEQGILPTYAESKMVVDDVSASVEGTTMAVGVVTAVELAPAMMRALSKISNNEVPLTQASSELWQDLQQNDVSGKITSATKKIVTAGGVSFMTGMNASFTTFLVTYAWDIVSFYTSFQKGEISYQDMMQRIKLAGLDRGVLSFLAYAAVNVAGPLGLLVPIIIQWLGLKAEDAKKMEHGLNELFHSWLHQFSEKTQYKSELWQLNYAMSVQNTTKSNLYLDTKLGKQQVKQELVKGFEQVVKNDQLDNIIEIKDHRNIISQLESQKIENLTMIAKITNVVDIDSAINRFMIENANNKKIIESAILDAMVLLDPKSVDDNHQNKIAKSLLQKLGEKLFYRGLTSQDIHLQKLTTAQIAAMRIVNSLQHDQTMSLEFITLLQKYITNFEEKLMQVSNEQAEDLTKVYHSMSQVYVKLRNSIIDNEQRISNIEKNLVLQEWLNLTNVQKYNGKTLMQLDKPLRLAVIINEFIQHTEAKWTRKDLFVLNEMLFRAGFTQPSENVYFERMFENSEVINKLFERLLLIERSFNDSDDDIKWISQVYQNHSFSLPEVFKNQYYSDNMLWENILTLLWYIKNADIRTYRLQTAEVQKQNWLKGIDKVNNLIERGILSTSLIQQVDMLKKAIMQFKLVVPIIGKYSVGKSTLLNRWLETNIQNTDLGACTSVPTEFHFAPQLIDEKLILAYSDDEGKVLTQSIPVSDYVLINQKRIPLPNNIQHIQLHLHLPALALHPDLVLVDTPGLESNVGSHERALMQYSGVVDSSFILCVSKNHLGEEEKRFVSRQYSLGKHISLLVCQEDLISKNDRQAVRYAIAEQAEFDSDYGIIRGCSAFDNDLKGFSDILNHIEGQKSYLFEQKFKGLVDDLLMFAKVDLEQRINDDYTQEDLLQLKLNIEESIKNLKYNYEKMSRKMSLNAKGIFSNQVSENVKNFISSRKGNYLQALNNNSKDVQQLILADIQNALELSIEQIVFPELQKNAKHLEESIVLKYDYQVHSKEILNNIVQVNNSNDNLEAWGGMIGASAGVFMGATLTTMPFLIVPGVILGSLLKENIRQNKLQEALHNQINEAYMYIDRVIPDYMDNLVTFSLNQIYDSLQAKLTSEQDKISAIESQIQADKEDKQRLLDTLQQCIDEINQMISELKV